MTVNVEAGAVIAAGRYGILVDGGGLDGETGRRKHFVSVDGSVSGASAGIHLPNGGTVSVGSSGRVGAASGVAIDAVAGDLMAAISGMVDGDVRARGNGEHTVTVAAGGAVSGTIHLAGSTVTVHGSAGCVVLDNGGVVNVGASGRISCPDGGVQSGSGDLTVDVAGEVMGDIRARGDGEQVVTVAEGGAVSGTVRLAAPGSDVTVDGEIGSAILDKGGMVTVGANGRVEGGRRHRPVGRNGRTQGCRRTGRGRKRGGRIAAPQRPHCRARWTDRAAPLQTRGRDRAHAAGGAGGHPRRAPPRERSMWASRRTGA